MGKEVSLKCQENAVKQYDWSSNIVKYVIVRLLKSFESYFWCLRYDFCNRFKIPHAGTGKECAKKRFLSMDAQMLVIVGSLAGMIFSAGHSPFAIVVFAVVGFSSVLDFTFLRMRLERNEEVDRCNDNNGTGGNGTGNKEWNSADDETEGECTCGEDCENKTNGTCCRQRRTEIKAVMDRGVSGLLEDQLDQEFWGQLVRRANKLADDAAQALFGGYEDSQPAFVFSGVGGKCHGGGLGGKVLQSGMGG